jgi:hypothetical protein
MYAVFEMTQPSFRKARVMADVTFASLTEAVDYFNGAGGFAEVDPDGYDAADVLTKGGQVLTVEPI